MTADEYGRRKRNWEHQLACCDSYIEKGLESPWIAEARVKYMRKLAELDADMIAEGLE